MVDYITGQLETLEERLNRLIAEEKPVIICELNDARMAEGQMDFQDLIAVGQKDEAIFKLACLPQVKIFVLAFPNSEQGDKRALEIARRLGKIRCLRVFWPEELARGDVNQRELSATLAIMGAEKVLECFDQAKPYPIAGLFTVEQSSPNLEKYFDEGFPQGNSTGIEALDKVYTVVSGQLTLVTGIPGHGKSKLVDCILLNQIVQYDWRVAIYSPENHPFEVHMARLLAQLVNRPFHKDHHNRMSREEMLKGKKFLESRIFYLLPEKPTVDALLELVRASVVRHGIKAFVLDPWNWLDLDAKEWANQSDLIGQALRKIKLVCSELDLHAWIVAHPAKISKDKNGEYPVVKPYDVAHSAEFFNKSDMILSIWRDVQKGGNVEVHAQKIKNEIYGKIGMAELGFNASTGNYRNPGEEIAFSESRLDRLIADGRA